MHFELEIFLCMTFVIYCCSPIINDKSQFYDFPRKIFNEIYGKSSFVVCTFPIIFSIVAIVRTNNRVTKACPITYIIVVHSCIVLDILYRSELVVSANTLKNLDVIVYII